MSAQVALAAAYAICVRFNWRYNRCYTKSMKTAVSLPDELFRAAEAATRRLRVSRSQLYATAISEFLDRNRSESVTRRLNEVYSKSPAKIDPALLRAQLKNLRTKDW